MKHWQFGLAALLLLGGCTTAVEAPPASVVIIEPSPAVEAPQATEDQALTPEPAAPPVAATTTDPAPAVASLNLPVATVISVGDGDTLRMDYQGQTVTVRFACIDAPETSQTPWGPAAAERLRQLTPRGSTIQFREADTDRYGRMVAEVYAGGQLVNLQMVREGHAVVYTQFLSSCPQTQDLLLQAEAEAQQQRLNFWNQPNPVMPWDYRRGDRSGTAPAPAQAATKDSSPLPNPSGTPSRAPVQGSCECPYDTDSAGRSCGGRSSYSRSGGSEGACYL
ncbi:thermonuclease family protein [Leptolyngbya sp. BL0902]|uniref:thermonuclease family protein n=1 Tax=Leptolyngbya sp. BL0902 TaxID=1115757 RepID=UPI0018E8DDCE|nr:thermonuclease family protein [Leptolyngbya sp. BL0902]